MRQRRFKGFKMKWPPVLDGAKELVINNLFAALAVAVFIALGAISINLFLHTSYYFRVRDVDASQTPLDVSQKTMVSGDILKVCRGRNIFDVDIRYLAKSLETSYPDARSIVVKRVFPDKIGIAMDFRRPIAVVSDSRLYPVDEESFVMPATAEANHIKDLPVILGVDVRLDGRRGKRHDSPNLKAAIALIKELKRSRLFQGYGCTTIDAGDMKAMSFYLRNGLEVRIGCEDIKKRLESLRKVLRDPRLLIDKVQYIDLRFADVVIGPK